MILFFSHHLLDPFFCSLFLMDIFSFSSICNINFVHKRHNFIKSKWLAFFLFYKLLFLLAQKWVQLDSKKIVQFASCYQFRSFYWKIMLIIKGLQLSIIWHINGKFCARCSFYLLNMVQTEGHDHLNDL